MIKKGWAFGDQRRGEGITFDWRGEELVKAAAKATGRALQRGAQIISDEAIKNVAKHKLKKRGGYGKVPGYLQTVIGTGPTSARGESVGTVLVGFPAFQVEYGTRRSKKVYFLHDAVQSKKWEVLEALKDETL